MGRVRVRRLCHLATLPTSEQLAEWVYRHKSLLYKELVTWSRALCHVATVSGSLPQPPGWGTVS
jgi:hypothetical protein